MKAEKEEVKLRRRSRSFVGIADDHEQEAIQLRRRSNSFHSSNFEIGGDRRASAASVSTPVSPVMSEDEDELSRHGERGCNTDQQISIEDGADEFSLSLDDGGLESPMSQPEPTALSPTTDLSPTKSRNTTATRRRSSKLSIAKFHSTPVKDANGYIRPLCAPFVRELNFDEPAASHSQDEPDFGGNFNAMEKDSSSTGEGKEQPKSSDEDDAPFRTKIPSISLQRNSSHSSLEDWDENDAAAPNANMTKKISKSRSLESSLDVSALKGNERARAPDDMNDVVLTSLNPLALSRSIPSLDSDSVFSVEDEEEEEREGEGDREREREEKEGTEGGDKSIDKDQQQRRDVSSALEQSIDSEFSVEGDRETNSRVTRSLPATTLRSLTSQLEHSSPVSAATGHSREQSFSTVDSSSVRLNHDDRDTSFSPINTSAADPVSQRDGKNHSSPKSMLELDTSLTNELTRTQERHSFQRSKSTSGSTNYIGHKWCRKKAATPASSSTTTDTSTLNNADPFHLLRVYQVRSHDCFPTTATCRVDFRTLLSKLNNNSETRNYELSFEREP